MIVLQIPKLALAWILFVLIIAQLKTVYCLLKIFLQNHFVYKRPCFKKSSNLTYCFLLFSH